MDTTANPLHPANFLASRDYNFGAVTRFAPNTLLTLMFPWALAVAANIIRFVHRAWERKFGIDDTSAFLAFLLLISTQIGFMCIFMLPDPPDFKLTPKLSCVDLFTFQGNSWSIALARISGLLFYRRVTSGRSKTINWTIWITVALCLATGVSITIRELLRCKPRHLLGKCWHGATDCWGGYFAAATGERAVQALCILPLTFLSSHLIYHLKVPLKMRLLISVIPLLTIIDFIIAILRLAWTISVLTGGSFLQQRAYFVAPDSTLTPVELSVAMFTVSLPACFQPMKKLVKYIAKLFGKTTTSGPEEIPSNDARHDFRSQDKGSGTQSNKGKSPDGSARARNKNPLYRYSLTWLRTMKDDTTVIEMERTESTDRMCEREISSANSQQTLN